jgi:hypothetical protein
MSDQVKTVRWHPPDVQSSGDSVVDEGEEFVADTDLILLAGGALLVILLAAVYLSGPSSSETNETSDAPDENTEEESGEDTSDSSGSADGENTPAVTLIDR